MVEIFTQYFIQHHLVSLSGLGKLSVTPVPAYFDMPANKMAPPRFQFNWQPQTGEPEDGLQKLAGFISRRTQLSEEESYDSINACCDDIKNILEEKGEFNWVGIGKLVRLSGGLTGFVPDAAFNECLPVLDGVRVFSTGKTHSVKVGDAEVDSVEMQQMLMDSDETEQEGRWWIIPLLLALAGIGLIVSRLGGWI